MKRLFLSPLLALALVPAHAEEGEWETIFDGETLNGWTPKIRGHEAGVNDRDTFRAGDGVLRVDYSGYERWDNEFGHLFYEKKFSHYRLKLEYRFTGEQLEGGPGWAFRNSGIMIHSESPETMALEQDFPTSIEVQLLGGGGTGERPTGNLCTPGTHVVMNDRLHTDHCTNSNSKTFHGDDWVEIEVEVRGNDLVRHLINGEEVMAYSKPQYDVGDAHAKALSEVAGDVMISEGYFCLQSESHPVEFRNIRIQVLEP